MRSILTLALKDIRLLSRDWFGLFWILIFPIVYALFFGAIFGGASSGGSRKMSVALIDEESSAGSKAFALRLQEKSEALEVKDMTLDEAREAVRKGKLVAYLVLKSGFGKSANPFSGQTKHIELGIDPSRQAE